MASGGDFPVPAASPCLNPPETEQWQPPDEDHDEAHKPAAPGTVFIPLHYCEADDNVISSDAFDPTVRIAEPKVCALRSVSVKKTVNVQSRP